MKFLIESDSEILLYFLNYSCGHILLNPDFDLCSPLCFLWTKIRDVFMMVNALIYVEYLIVILNLCVLQNT